MGAYKWTGIHPSSQAEIQLNDFDVLGFEDAVKAGMPLKEAYVKFGVNPTRIDSEHRAALAEASQWARVMTDKEPYSTSICMLEIAVLGDNVFNGLFGDNHWKNRERAAISL
jgi:hypothetical protein